MRPTLVAEPWGILKSEEPDRIELPSGAAEEPVEIDGSATLRLVTQLGRSAPWYGERREKLPPVSFPFRWLDGSYQQFAVPFRQRRGAGKYDASGDLAVDGRTYRISQVNLVARPDSGTVGDVSAEVSAWVHWQVHCFQELAGRPEDPDAFAYFQDTRTLTRAPWERARAVWLEGGADDARRALIVELAESGDLHGVLAELARAPRQVLERVRASTRIDRIQELDAACLRDYARRPGRDALEKGGTCQELLAVKRRSTRDTLENRVCCWVLEAIEDLAREYVRDNRSWSSSRVSRVGKLRRLAGDWRRSEALAGVDAAPLVHPVTPNYPLQMERRYKFVFDAYKRIRRERQVVDDAWEWQRVLWAETARQLLYCGLSTARLRSRFEEPFASTPYYRREGSMGRWTAPPIAPGPFDTPRGRCFVYDARDLPDEDLEERRSWCTRPPFPGAQHVGVTGCDLFLHWPRDNAVLLTWLYYTTGIADVAQAAVKRAARAIQRLAEILETDGTRMTLNGLILLSDMRRSGAPGTDRDLYDTGDRHNVVGLRIPRDIHKRLDELDRGLESALQAILGRTE